MQDSHDHHHSIVLKINPNFINTSWRVRRNLRNFETHQQTYAKRAVSFENLTKMWTLILILATAGQSQGAQEIFRDCTRDLYDRVVRFEYLYYEGYWMYPYNKLRNHGPSYHYTEKNFCK